jgi:EpsI family protein
MKDKIRFSCLAVVLLFSTVELRLVPHGHTVPPRRDFDTFPLQVNDWSGKDNSTDPKVLEVLAADNFLSRDYQNNSTGKHIDFSIVYYSVQRSGDAIHDPQNCLQGAGWEPVSMHAVQIPNPSIPGQSIAANHFVIQKNGVEEDVLYRYQAHGRVYANPYLGKIYLVWDGITKGRTDGALIRFAAARDPGTSESSFPAMMAFAQDLSSVLPQLLPNRPVPPQKS